MARTLDRTRDFASIYGESVYVQHEQDGVRFDHEGRELVDGVPAPTEDEEARADQPLTYKEMTVVQLRTLVESFGARYTNKAAAIDFLTGRTANSLATLDEQ